MEPQVQTDIFRRAELFTLIADLVRACEGSPSGGAFDPRPPRLTVLDRRVFVNGLALDLSHRPLMLRLFQAFAESRDGWLTREDLLLRVYRVRVQQRSERYIEAVLANAVKLVSRARAVSASFLAQSGGPGYEWFVYDGDRKAWALVRERCDAPGLIAT